MLHPQAPHKSHAERIAQLHTEHEVRLKYLKEREDEKARKRKEALRKVAPGYEPPEDDATTSGRAGEGWDGRSPADADTAHHRRSGILEPTRKTQNAQAGIDVDEKVGSATSKSPEVGKEEVKVPRDVMDDLVEGLARMDELESKTGQ